ncbi:MAG TPA: hypothetical protein PLQ81_09140, partial [bacterium]|nr:hypothetical protein [bacterium]
MLNAMKKIILISISLFYLTIAILTGNAGNIASYALFLILPLSCIFFSAELGNWTGIMRFQKITSKSPA